MKPYLTVRDVDNRDLREQERYLEARVEALLRENRELRKQLAAVKKETH